VALLAGVGVAAALGGGWWALDRLAARIYGQQRPRLERQLGRIMGHPLQLGAYRGLKPLGLGLQVGPSRFLPGLDNPSTVEAQGLVLGVDPLRSLWQRALVLELDLQRPEALLRANRRGSYWEFPPQKAGLEPPRLGLRIRLADPARVRLITESARGPKALALRLEGSSELQLWRRQVAWSGRLDAATGGQLGFAGRLQWRQRSLELQLHPRQLPLEPALALLPRGLQQQLAGRVEGRLQGSLALQRRPGGNGCRGGLALEGWRWRPPGVPQALSGDPLLLRCTAEGLALRPTPLRLGDWRGRLSGQLRLAARRTSPGGWLQLQLQAATLKGGERLLARLAGPWRQPDLRLQASLPGLQLQARMALRSRPSLRVLVPSLQLRHREAVLQASGALWPRLDLRSQSLQLQGGLPPQLVPLLGPRPALQAQLQQQGPWSQLRLQLDLRQRRNPLVGDLLARLLWRPGQLELQSLAAERLSASGRLPLGPRGGPLRLRFDLRRFPLERLSPLVGTRLRGDLDAWGVLEGPLQALRSDLQLLVRDPGAGPLWLRESWSGELRGALGADARLRLQPLAPAPAGLLQARLDRRGFPTDARLQRGGGSLRLAGSPRRYRWSSNAVPLAGLQLALGPRQVFRPLQGALSGAGQLELQPLAMAGSVRIAGPQLLGVYGSSLSASGSLRGRRLELRGRWADGRQAAVGFRARTEPGGALWTRFEARRLGGPALRQLLAAWPLWNGAISPSSGDAADLGLLDTGTLGLDLSGQLAQLRQARAALNAPVQPTGADGDVRLDPADLEALLDADLTLVGSRSDQLFIDLRSRGHLWLRGDDRDLALSKEPVLVRLQGPLNRGGSFSIQYLPLALMGLLAPVPEGLRGSLSLQGRYGLPGRGRPPQLELELALQDAGLRDRTLQLDRGRIALENNRLALDWALRSGGASNSVDLKGVIPLQASAEGLELRVASRGDGLRFLSVLGGPGLEWRRGSADLQLLVRGSRLAPVANGFLRFREGELLLAGQLLRDLDAVVLFDFTELEVQQLSARVGAAGQISGVGHLGLVTSVPQSPRQLKLAFRAVPITAPRLQTQADGEVLVGGSLRRPELAGELQLSRGSINISPSGLATAAAPTRPVSLRQLAEADWDFREPLLVMGQQLESAASQDLRRYLPKLSAVQLNGLRLRLGPTLRITVPNVLNFNTAGVLTLRGPLDPDIRISGVVRLLSGQLGLFITPFRLDPDAPNVAVFTPSQGLIPYVDIALRTSVADSPAGGTPSGATLSSSTIYDWNNATQGPSRSLEQLRLVKVKLQATGPADRLMENITLTSTPPLPKERLLALIGGNSLVGLLGANASAALATVLGQSLLTPVLGSANQVFGDRLSFALYPAYFVVPDVSPGSSTSNQLPSKLALGSEIGLDLTERFNFSVLAAPDRSDLPPQFNLRYQASDRVGVQGSIDTEGRWQSLIQMFLRF
jgi:translocation and assembly module TamB